MTFESQKSLCNTILSTKMFRMRQSDSDQSLFESNGIIVALGILDRKNPLVKFVVVLTTARAEGNEIGIRERDFTHSVESFIARISKFGEASLPRSVLT